MNGLPTLDPRAAAASGQPGPSRRLFVYNGGFLRQPRLRRILSLAGYRVTTGLPGALDLVGVWGHSPYARRGERIAAARGAGLLRIEDAFLRSLHPGRGGEAPLGLVIDRQGCHFDARGPSDLETILAQDRLEDPQLLTQARDLMALMQEHHLTKYAAVLPEAPLPAPGYVLVIDQTRGDASVQLGGAGPETFAAMLAAARAEHPGTRIIIKSHPETRAGHRPGHFGPRDTDIRTALLDRPVSPWALMSGAVAVYTVSSQLGFEAILAGHRPQVFGLPFYAGWGLSADRNPTPLERRGRTLRPEQLAAGALLRYPVWYDPCRDRLCRAEEAALSLGAAARAWREDHAGWTAANVRLWKRRSFQQFFGHPVPVRFVRDIPTSSAPRRQSPQRRVMSWAGLTPDAAEVVRVEDGFLRSRGLGAELVPPLSLTLDDLGIYYDPTRESRLDRLIAARAVLRPDQVARARALMAHLRATGLSKYNTGLAPALEGLPAGRRLLVPGQVEDDASIRKGAGEIRSNHALLMAARAAHPEAVILYKPHPDVEAGLRPGAVPEAATLADRVLDHADPAALLETVDELWTMTSLMGFEALIRGKAVTTLGRPFYAGWGLTTDLGPDVPHRRARPTLEGLIHAALIDYPRYRDPVSGQPCPVEVIAERLSTGMQGHGGPALRGLSKLQGILASRSALWRR